MCDVDSDAAIKFPEKKLKLAPKVLLRLINTRLFPCDHDTHIGRERVCLLYFLMIGQKVNVGHLIRHQIAQVRRSKKVDRLFFENMLTQYLRKEEVGEERESNMTIPTAIRGTDITIIRAKEDDDGFVLTGVERRLVMIVSCPTSMGCSTYKCRLVGGRLL